MENQAAVSLCDFLYRREYNEEEVRFMLDLEFVQNLGNVFYLKWLADNNFFDDNAFLSYLKYLLYWRTPEYSRYLVYPQCLYFLEKLQDDAFRFLLHDSNHIDFLNLECHLALRRHAEEPPKVSDDTV